MLDGERCIRCREYFKFEELTAGPDGFGICAACAVQIDPSKETKRSCPVDGAVMEKDTIQRFVIIDRCPQCKGVWLDGNELDVIRKQASEQFYYGLMVGIAIL